MQIQCPHCKEAYDVEKEQLGMTATCSACNNTFVLSAPAEKEPFKKPARKKKKGPGIMEVLGPYIKLIVFVGLVGGGGYYLYSKGMLGNKPKVEEKKDQAQTDQTATNNLFKEKTVGDAAITASNIDAAIIQRDKDRGFVFSGDNKTLLKAPKKIPSYTIPKGVVNIGPDAFSGCENLKEIVIPEGVQKIGKEAFFNCYRLESITIPNSVTDIGGNAFFGVKNLKISSSHPVFAFGKFGELINEETGTLLCLPVEFEGVYSVPAGITHIGNEAFFGCSKLSGITIHDNVVSIGNRAFWGCSKLTKIAIPNSVTKIGLGAFYGAAEVIVSKDHPTIKVDDSGALINPETKTLMYMSRKFKGHYTVPNEVAQIGDSAFSHCFELSGVTIPDTVISIGEMAFSNCLKLRSVMMPDSLSMIGANAFERCNSLTTITIPSNVKQIASGTFIECNNLQSVTITDGVTRIEDSAFAFCESLERVHLSKNIDHIGAKAFSHCTNLKRLGLLDEVRFIGERAFYECLKLENLNIDFAKNAVVGSEAFVGVLSVTTTISNCSYRSFHDYSIVEDKSGALIDKRTDTLIYFPRKFTGTYTIGRSGCQDHDECRRSYVRRIGRNAFYKCRVQKINIQSYVKTIEASAFKDCTNLMSVSIPRGIIRIEDETFENCKMLNNVSIPEGVTRIGGRAFWGCDKLTSIKIPEGVVQIGKNAFAGSGLEQIKLPESLVEIDESAFLRCFKLKNIKLPSGLARIGKNAFDLCSDLQELEIPINTYEIGDAAFKSQCLVKVSDNHPNFTADDNGGVIDMKHNTLLHVPRDYEEKYTVSDDVKVIGSHAFYGCKINGIKLPEGLEKIGAGAFGNCEKLKKIEIPEKVTSIDKGALGKIEIIKVAEKNPVFKIGSSGELIDFKNKTLVRMTPAFTGEYTVPAGIEKIAEGAFSDCKVAEVIISKEVKEIGKDAFSDCKALRKITIPEGVKKIGSGAFSGCSTLTEITIPAGISEIGSFAFSECSALTKITIPEGVTEIGLDAFYNCKNLTSVKLPASMKIVDRSAFSSAACEAQVKRVYQHLFD